MTSTNKHNMSKKRFYQQLFYEEFCTTGQRNHNMSQGLTSRAAFLPRVQACQRQYSLKCGLQCVSNQSTRQTRQSTSVLCCILILNW